jgi:RNA polymerase sigma factor (sigma-70 family)
MSPVSLRRYRAERLLATDFARLRARVLAAVRSRLGGAARALDASDLEACYAQAWHGLYAAIVEGQEVANTSGWLVTVTARRAIEELRLRRHERCAEQLRLAEQDCEPDLVERIDAARRLRELCEALRGSLSAREREAATLCYVLGFSWAEAAARMGISERRMRRLMEGEGSHRKGVAAKVGELLAVIRADRWCEQQGSLMRALALGVLEPGGERYALARMHERECPGCRRFVAALRSLAAVLPPLLPHGVLAGALSAKAGLGAGAASTKGAAGAGGGSTLLGAGSLAAGSTAAGAGAAGGFGSVLGSLALKAAIGALALGASGAIVAVNLRAHAHPAHLAARAAQAPEGSGAGGPAGAFGGLASSARAPSQSEAPSSPGTGDQGSSRGRAASASMGVRAAVQAASSEFGIEAPAGGEGEQEPARPSARSVRRGVRARVAERSAREYQPRASLSGRAHAATLGVQSSAEEGASEVPPSSSGAYSSAGASSTQARPAPASTRAGRAAEGEFSFE